MFTSGYKTDSTVNTYCTVCTQYTVYRRACTVFTHKITSLPIYRLDSRGELTRVNLIYPSYDTSTPDIFVLST